MEIELIQDGKVVDYNKYQEVIENVKESLFRRNKDKETKEWMYISNFVGILLDKDRLILSLPKSVIIKDGIDKEILLYKYARLFDLYFVVNEKKCDLINKYESIENWCNQAIKENKTTTMTQEIITFKFEMVFEWMIGEFFQNQISIQKGDVLFNSQLLDKEIDINDIKNKQVQTTVKDIRNFNSIYITKNDGAIDANKNKIKDSEIENLKEQIKEHISTSGSVKASIYMPNFDNNVHINLKSGAIYNLIDSYEDIKKEMTKKDGVYVNHAVSIIGWDDNYSKDNFSTKPTNNGAWIIRNSYGKAIEISMEQLRKNNPGLEDKEIVNTFSASMNCNCTLSEDGQILSVSVGDNGIFYVSYEDAYIYSDLLGIENVEDKKDYDNLYQYDNLGGGEVGYIKGNDVKDIFLANVFTRTKTDTEYLTSIGFQSLVEGTYEVYINPDGTDKSLSNLQKAELTTGEEISLTAGYHTINFKKAYKLKENNFVVAIKMKHKDGGISYFTYEAKEENPDIVLSKAKESFVVREEQAQKDSQWLDIGDSSSSSYLGNLCIKGITVNQYSGSIANEEEKEDSKTDNNNSNYDKAKAELQEIKLEGNNQGSSVNIKIKVTGIEVKNSSEKYQHYFYLSSNSKENNIQEDKWIPAGKFEKQDDGTYALTLEVTEESQLADIKEDGSVYVYIKEVATLNGKSTTLISNGIELKVDTSEIETKKEENTTTITSNTNKNDTTIANKVLPNTGYIPVIIFLIISFAIVGMFVYIRYKNIDK